MWQELLARAQTIEKLAEVFAKRDNVVPTDLTEALMRLDDELHMLQASHQNEKVFCDSFHVFVDNCLQFVREMAGRSIHSPEGWQITQNIHHTAQHMRDALRQRAQEVTVA